MWVACDARTKRQQTGGSASGQRAAGKQGLCNARARCVSGGSAPPTASAGHTPWTAPAAPRRPAPRRTRTRPASAPSAAPSPTRSRYVLHDAPRRPAPTHTYAGNTSSLETHFGADSRCALSINSLLSIIKFPCPVAAVYLEAHVALEVASEAS